MSGGNAEKNRPEPFDVTIIKCQREGFWYAEKVGEIFTVTGRGCRAYEVVEREEGGAILFIESYDCEEIEKKVSPLATASAELAGKGTPLVADAVCQLCQGIIDSPYVNARCNCKYPTVKRGDCEVRTFDSGATRDTDEGKYDYEGFLSPLVLECFAEYMNKHREIGDGQRDSDNWQKGIPRQAYMKSGWRHFFDWWRLHRGYNARETIKVALCGLLFNAMGYLHTLLEEER